MNFGLEAPTLQHIFKHSPSGLQKKGVKQDLGQFEVLRNIVSDADKLEAIGEIGLIRCLEHSKHVHPDYSEDQVSFVMF